MPEARSATRWFVIEGALLVILGILALLLPVMAGIAATLVFGWLLIAAGVVGLVSAFRSRGHAHLGWSVVSAVIALVVGLLLAWRPFAGALSLTLLLGAYLLLDGIALVILAFDQRRTSPRWGWMLASGVLDIVLALVIAFATPVTATVLVGFIVGLDLVFAGAALIGIGAGARRAARA